MDSKKIKISTENFSIFAELNDTSTAKKLIEILPLSAIINRWGQEIYFSIPMQAETENGVEEVEVGTLAFWPPGNALCIFFGKTPASRGELPQAASPVTVIGKIAELGAIEKLKQAKSGQKIEVMLG